MERKHPDYKCRNARLANLTLGQGERGHIVCENGADRYFWPCKQNMQMWLSIKGILNDFWHYKQNRRDIMH